MQLGQLFLCRKAPYSLAVVRALTVTGKFCEETLDLCILSPLGCLEVLSEY